jgi:hypothetical protein
MPAKKTTAKKTTAKKSTAKKPAARKPAAKSSAKKTTARKSTSKRELINTGSDKRYVRRNTKGEFKSSDDVGRSLSKDVKQRAKKVAPKGQGDRGDQKRK